MFVERLMHVFYDSYIRWGEPESFTIPTEWNSSRFNNECGEFLIESKNEIFQKFTYLKNIFLVSNLKLFVA